MNSKFLMKLMDPGFLFKFAAILLLVSLVFIAEIFLIQFVGGLIGSYFTLAVVALTGLAGLFLSYYDISSIITVLKEKAADGEFPEREMFSFSGALLGGLFLLIPGFLTDFLGLIALFPVVKMLYGRVLLHGRADSMHELYEYLRIYE